MPTLRIMLFGPPQVVVDDVLIHVPLDKALALLAYLAVTQIAHRRDHLATLFWPDASQPQARAYLRNALYTLLKCCGDGWIQSDRNSIGLAPDASIDVDVCNFLAQIAATTKTEPGSAAVEALTHAVALARGDFLAGFSLPDAPEFDEWQRFQRQSLLLKVEEALSALIAYHQQQFTYDEAIAYAQRWIALDDLNEKAHRALMHLYALSGQDSAALHQYGQLVRLLDDELGIPPSDKTAALYRQISERLSTPPTLPMVEYARFSSAAADTVVGGDDKGGADVRPIPNNLPQQLTSCVGREQELAQLDQLLADESVHLITLVGPGGIGKTRLAVAYAERQLQNQRFQHGVYFVALDSISDPDRLAATIAAAIDYKLQSSGASSRTIEQQVVDYVRQKQMLLVLDNMEHLLHGLQLIIDIVRSAPGVRLLVTSREWLRLTADQVFAIQGLDYGDTPAREPSSATVAFAAALRLFEDRARRRLPSFSLQDENLAHVVEICRLVEGMPLAIELAAAWVDLLSPAEIAQEIRRSLNFLETEMRDLPRRHHSIRAVCDGTWQRLNDSEQAVFATLSVFHGGFTRQAAQEVAGATLPQLDKLVGKSMIRSVRQDSQRVRYEIHSLLRQYGAMMLAESSVVVRSARALHCAYFVDFLETRLPIINGLEQGKAASDIAEEIHNIHAAWHWAIDNDNVDAIHRAATTLFLFCQVRSHFLDGAEMLAAAAASLRRKKPSSLRDSTLAQVLNHEGWLRIRLGDFERAATALELSRLLYAQPHMPPPPPYMGTDPGPPLAIIAKIRGNYHEALALGTEALRAASSRGDAYNQSYAHYALTSAYAASGDYVAATQHARQACDLAEAVGNRFFLAILLDEWGRVARAVEDYAQAGQHFSASYEISRTVDNREGMAVALNHLGEIAVLQHNIDEAKRFYQEAHELYRGIGDRVGTATSQRGMAQVAHAQRDEDVARMWFAQALEIAADTHYLPLLFAILVDVGELLLAQGAISVGIRALQVVEQHPSTDHETKARATRSLNHWRASIGFEWNDKTAESTHDVPLQAIVTLLQAELLAPK